MPASSSSVVNGATGAGRGDGAGSTTGAGVVTVIDVVDAAAVSRRQAAATRKTNSATAMTGNAYRFCAYHGGVTSADGSTRYARARAADSAGRTGSGVVMAVSFRWVVSPYGGRTLLSGW